VNPQCKAVLAKLRSRKGGITFDDFARGFRLGARIFDLRESGYGIETVMEQVGDCTRARYVLRGEP
jgi:Helix-turn-helix domain